MSIAVLILIVIGCAVAAYFVRRAKMIEEPFRTGLVVILVIIAILAALQAFGILDAIRGARVPRVAVNTISEVPPNNLLAF